MDGLIYNKLLETKEKLGAGFLMLIDPDKIPEENYLALADAADECGVDAILVGTSFMLSVDFPKAIKKIKERTDKPVIIFPGSFAQINPFADAILFSSLLSGRNPVYLIEEQIKGAPLIKRCGIEPIPTGYLLVESGAITSVLYISGTQPIPREKADIACAHALAAQYMGMKLVYLEAGSGAEKPIPTKMVQYVSSYIDIPVIVGGGLRTPESCAERVNAGASFIVVGNSLEKKFDPGYIKDLASAVHYKGKITV